MNDHPWILPLAAAHDAALVGGKAASLSRLINAGLPVPPGFALTTAAFEAWRDAGRDAIPAEILAALLAAYRALGDVTVAVRSSATAEDGAAMSMAGQYETILGVRGAAELQDAVRRCWHASNSERVTGYLAGHAVAAESVSLALVVQRLVPADAAGVLFTANPRNGRRREMLLEAAWGLGEAVVSGKVQPDILVLDRDTGDVREAVIAEKSAVFDSSSGALRPLAGAARTAPVLTTGDVHVLADLGRRIETLYGAPQDIEWALHEGRAFILQSRPITTLAAVAAQDAVLGDTRARLLAALDAGRGPWVEHNLGETAPRPTPLTWSVLQRFMSGSGGYGKLLREIGFTPGPVVAHDGFLELIGGRIYLDVARAPEMFGEKFPFRYDLEKLRADPAAAGGPPTIPHGSMRALGRASRLVAAVGRRLDTLAVDLDHRLASEIIPAFDAWVAEEKKLDLSALTPAGWGELWHAREQRTMDQFAPQSLLPSMLCVLATDRLRQFLAAHFWTEDSDALLATLSVPSRPDATLRSNSGLREVAEGRLPLERWLADFGHRAPEEFELATPRWSDRPATIATLAGHWRGQEDPAAKHAAREHAAQAHLARLTARLSAADAAALRAHVSLLARFLPYREDGKHHLMLGYGLLRDLALEAGRRLWLGEKIFLLTQPEIAHALRTGYAPHALLAERRLRRAAEEKLITPPLITRAEAETFGAPPPIDAAAEQWPALPLASGRASGPVRVLSAPDQLPAGERGFVLVCTTTDTGWTPLFASAAAVIVECGGSLSHGAVVAREMGVPAVTLPGATRLFRDGEIVTVDGRQGQVARGAAHITPSSSSDAAPLAREQLPPPPGPGEARSARWRRIGFIGWGLFLAAFFLLPPAWLHDPVIQGLDRLLWPLVAAWGKAATVAFVAAVTATLTLVGQRVLNDHARLVAAKQRWQRLQAEAAPLPLDAPRRARLSAASAGVQARLTLASFTPLALLLGPMVISFMWLTERIDPAVWNPAPGSRAEIVALIAGDHTQPVSLDLPEGLRFASHSSPAQKLPLIRPTLEGLLQRWQAAPTDDTLPWDVRAAAKRTRSDLLADLQAYLARPIPPQPLAWTVELPADKSGAFPITLRTAGATPATLTLVAGDSAPPAPRALEPSDSGLVRALSVDYREARVRGDRIFWAPFASLGWSWDAGWLGVYLAVYLPLMFILRLGLRLP
ncbi:MAG: PEP/pyruvate-binding domain-containing protein [Opitutaceae bacterium]|nr:PEP/pyruvate-binding domain-containing protein [Opitutaceae bacterium]